MKIKSHQFSLPPLIQCYFFLLIFLSSTTVSAIVGIDCKHFTENKYNNLNARALKDSLKNMQFEEAIKDDSLVEVFYCLSQETGDPEVQLSALNFLSMKYFEKSLFEEAKILTKEIIANPNAILFPNELARAHNYLCIILNLEGNALSAYKHNTILLDLCKKHNLELLPQVYLNLGLFHFNTQDYDQAEDFYLQGVETAEKMNIPLVECGWLLHRLGELYQVQNRVDDALFFINKAMAYWDKTNNQRAKCFTTLQLATVYYNIKQNTKAYKLLEEVRKISHENDFWLSEVEVLSYIGKLNFLEKKYKDAIKYIEKSDAIRLKHSIPFHFGQSYKILAEAYAADNQPLKANESYKHYLSEIASNSDNENAIIKEWVKKNKDLLDNKRNLKLLEQQSQFDQKKMTLQNRLIIVSIFLILFLILLARSYFQTNRKSLKHQEKLLALNKTIKEQSQQLQKANKNIVEQKDALELELVKKLLMLSKQAEAVQKIDLQLTKMPETSDNLDLRKHIMSIKNDSTWDELDIQITQSNSLLFEKLSQKFDNLSQSDLRLCAFLKMNMRTKEIAHLTFRNPASIKVSRSRLRKKLGLTHSSMTISTFLNRL